MKFTALQLSSDAITSATKIGKANKQLRLSTQLSVKCPLAFKQAFPGGPNSPKSYPDSGDSHGKAMENKHANMEVIGMYRDANSSM